LAERPLARAFGRRAGEQVGGEAGHSVTGFGHGSSIL
jgi:hypothetical protein